MAYSEQDLVPKFTPLIGVLSVIASVFANCAAGFCVGRFEPYLSFCESGMSYSVTTVTFATAFAAGFSSLVATT